MTADPREEIGRGRQETAISASETAENRSRGNQSAAADLTPAQLAEIRQRAEKATPGPWGAVYSEDGEGEADLFAYSGGGGHVVAEFPDYDNNAVQDAEFCAHARQDVPDLLAHIAHQDATIAALREALDILDFDGADDAGWNLDEAMKGVECGRRSRNLLERVRDQLARARAALSGEKANG